MAGRWMASLNKKGAMSHENLTTLLDALTRAGLSPSVSGEADRVLSEIRHDSREVGAGELFVALRGVEADGHRFVSRAVEAGASAILVDHDYEGVAPPGVAVVRVGDTREALAHASAAFFGHPGRALKVVGLTGTNGKTTTTYLLEQVALAAGLSPGVIGTVNRRFAGQSFETRNTTPESLELQRLLRRMVDAGVEVVFLEVSSHALVTHRVAGLPIRVGAFLNLSQDHLDFHGTMEAYFEAKCRLFTEVLPWSQRSLGEPVAAVVNVGDVYGPRALAAVPSSVRAVAFDAEGAGDAEGCIALSGAEMGGWGSRLEIVGGGFGSLRVETSLLGRLNAENTLAAVACARALGVGEGAIREGLAAIKGVPGRLERVGRGEPLVVVDYAHTPRAVERALASLRPLVSGRLVTVLGCGGDRDKGKRPQMGLAAARHSDLVVVTSDNPRWESPESIVEEMIAGGIDASGSEAWSASWGSWLDTKCSVDLSSGDEGGGLHLVELSRRRAVAAAIGLLGQEDGVLIAGKGHEPYQEIEGERFPLSDVEEAASGLSSPSGRRVVEVVAPGEWAEATGGRLIGEARGRWRDGCAGVETDSRRVVEGSVFVALAGERFDGHAFLGPVVEAGASLVVVSGEAGEEAAAAAWSSSGRRGQTLVVGDTLEALGAMATEVLRVLRRARPWFTAVAITGSNGKTTTKELVASLLVSLCGLEAGRVHKTPSNYNNLVGLPLTIFGLCLGHDAAVLEMGANAFGEIRRLAAIAAPEVRVLTSIGGAHLEGFGTLEGVLRAKSEMFEAMSPGQLAIAPLAQLRAISGKLPEGVSLGVFSVEVSAASGVRRGEMGVSAIATGEPAGGSLERVRVVLSGIDSDHGEDKLASARGPAGELEIEVSAGLFGEHNASNLCAAVLSAVEVGRRLRVWGRRAWPSSLDLRGALRLPGGRLSIKAGGGDHAGVRVIDDCYNANPASMEAGLRVLMGEAGARGVRSVAVLGDMFELGEGAEALHGEVGRVAAGLGVDALVTFGRLSRAMAEGARGVEGATTAIYEVVPVDGGRGGEGDIEAVLARIVEIRRGGEVAVLVKGSRGMRMERVVERLLGHADREPEGS